MVWSKSLAIALGSALPVTAAEVTEQSINERAAADATLRELAQFKLPEPAREPQLPKRLTYQYGYGSESDIIRRTNPDLDKRLNDNFLLLTPQLNANVTYRPTDWLDITLEMILEREIPAREEDSVTLPDGQIQFAKKREFSLLVDQAFVTIKDFTAPFEFAIGRRNYEDERHWLYDTSMDIVSTSLKLGKFRAEALVGRKVLMDMDLLQRQKRERINTGILYADYRGIEGIKVAAYTVFRDDQHPNRLRREGDIQLFGLRSQGVPIDPFSYWIELAHMRGRDPLSRDFLAYAFDVGATYRFLNLPLNPNVTAGFAFATGDNPRDIRKTNKNNEFRQTGLQSNEAKFAGLSDFKTYGEVLDPELSNLKILTVGLGFRPTQTVSVDFVYHDYRLDEIAEEIRNWPFTAQMNQVDTQLRRPSRDVGSAVDIVLGFRKLFGIRRLGVDLRVGWFFPGKAFLRNEGDEDNPIIRGADKGFTLVAKFWW